MKLLFAEESAVYTFEGATEKEGYIRKLPVFNTEQDISRPDKIFYFHVPLAVNEAIYYYCFVESLKDRNYESAYYYATHVTEWLTRKIYHLWFSYTDDSGFDSPPTISMMYAQIRSNLTMASMFFDVYSDHDNCARMFPLELQLDSRFKKRTRPHQLACIPPPFHFVENELSFTLHEIEEPVDFIAETDTNIRDAVQEIIQNLEAMRQDEIDEDHSVFLSSMMNTPVYQETRYLEFRKGPYLGDYCLVQGNLIAAGIIEVRKLCHPCVFLRLHDCNEEPWITAANYRTIKNNLAWKVFQELLRFSIDTRMTLFFNITPTNTFVSLE